MIGMNFGEALVMLKEGKRVTRLGWNGKNMHLGYCSSAPIQEAAARSTDTGPRSEPFIYMKTADGKYVPWLASQTDILAEDWGIA